MEHRIRMHTSKAGGLNSNAIAQTPDLAGLGGGRTNWHPRFLQFPTMHQVEGPFWDGMSPLMKGALVLSALGAGVWAVNRMTSKTRRR